MTPQDLLGVIEYEWNRRAKARLASFVERAWRYFEAGPYSPGKHIEVMAASLEAVNRGERPRLLINLPRRHTKSDLVSICWPAWTWLQADRGWPLAGPWVRFIFASHSHDLALELSRKCRTLIESRWYQELAGGAVRLREDANTVQSWQLTTGGGRRAFSIETRQTGFGADIFVIDDPHDIREVESAASRESARIFFQELVPGSINDPNNHARVVVAQRTHAKDLSATIIEGDEPYHHLCLPGLFDPEHPHRSVEDWRETNGEPLWRERFTPENYQALAGTAYARAAQVQQDPTARGAGVFGNANWQLSSDFPRHIRLVRWWDKASTAEGAGNDPDFTAGVLGGFDENGLFWLVDIIRGRWSSRQVEQRIRLTAHEIDGKEVAIFIEEEPGSSGKDVIAHYQRLLKGYAVRPDRATGAKLTRVDPLLAAAEAGNVVLVQRAYNGSNGLGVGPGPATWISAFLTEAEMFTGEDDGHDDQIVAAAGCFNRAAGLRRDSFSAGRLLGI